MPKVENADFDTNLFGFKVGRIEIDENEPKAISSGVVLEGLLRSAYAGGIQLIYLFCPPVSKKSDDFDKNLPVPVLLSSPASKTSEKHIPGIRVDIKTTFTIPINKIDRNKMVISAFLSANGVQIVRLSKSETPVVSPALRELAIASGEWSRFKVDMNVPRAVFETMFECWIKNSVNFSISDEVFVATDVKTGEEIGFISLKLKGTTVHVGLLAVSKNHRRRGIATQLMSRAALWAVETVNAASNGILSVVTQGANETACAFYHNFGFELTLEQDVYHIWLPQHLEEPLMRADQAPIPYCKQFLTGKEQQYVQQVLSSGLDSAARFTIMCSSRLKVRITLAYTYPNPGTNLALALRAFYLTLTPNQHLSILLS